MAFKLQLKQTEFNNGWRDRQTNSRKTSPVSIDMIDTVKPVFNGHSQKDKKNVFQD